MYTEWDVYLDLEDFFDWDKFEREMEEGDWIEDESMPVDDFFTEYDNDPEIENIFRTLVDSPIGEDSELGCDSINTLGEIVEKKERKWRNNESDY